MSRIWRVISVLAVANLVALVGLVGWLVTSGRLDGARAGELRAMLSETVADQRAREAAAAQDEALAAEALAQQASLEQPPITFTEQFALKLEQTSLDEQRVARTSREIEDLRRSLQLEQTRLADERAAFERDRAAFNETRERLASTEGAEQFRKAVGVLEGLKPPEAVLVLSELIKGRVPVLDTSDSDAVQAVADPALGLEQAVSYLNAMQGRVRTKVMNEFVKQDQTLAADLLERLRTRGLRAQASGADVEQ